MSLNNDMENQSFETRRRLLRTAIISTSALASLLPMRAEAASQKISFQQYVTNKLDDIDATLGAGVTGQLGAISDTLATIQTAMSACDSSAGDANDITAVRNTLEEIVKILQLR
jgi:hypothetical protein